MRGRLFYIDVLAGVTGEYRGGRVPVVRRGNDDGIDGDVVEDAAQVPHRRRTLAGDLLDLPGGPGVDALVGIAETNEIDVGLRREARRQAAPPAANADDGYVDLVVGRRRRVAQCGASSC